MSFQSRFDHDVFISYRHSDNLRGWITEFDRLLRVRLTELLGREAKIWRDPKMNGTDLLWDEVVERLANAAVLVSILTPGWKESNWCQRELDEFQNMAITDSSLRVGNKIRIAKVVKTPLEGNFHKQILSDVTGFEFYEATHDSRQFREFGHESQAFKDELDRLAHDIRRILLLIQEQMEQQDRTRRSVYLAETTADLSPVRDKILRELKAQGYRVLPESQVPDDSEVRMALEQARMSVHFFGPSYRCVVAQQYMEAKNKDISRVVWISKDARRPQPEQDEFLRTLRNESQSSLELLENRTIEELKDIVLDKLKLQSLETGIAKDSDDLVRIYLMCEREDHPFLHQEPNNALLLRNYLIDDEGFEVKLPVASQVSASQMRRDNEEKLKQCDAVLLYWGCVSEDWVDEKLRELIQALRLRESHDFASKAIYATDPRNVIKEKFRTLEANIIKHFDTFSPNAFQDFLRPLREKRKAKGAQA